ncbi:MAG: hypothetical protein ACPGO5_01165 [Patescibacteria group bacterium]
MIIPYTTSSFPLWWLETPFGEMIFIMFFITWGLIIVNLFLMALALSHYIFKKRRHYRRRKIDRD